jgi:co-chaperonin GroES (HSP10)
MHFKKNQNLKFKELKDIPEKDLPQCLMWHCLVQPYEVEEETAGGFMISQEDAEEYKKVYCLGKVVQMGELCFKEKQFHGTRPFDVGDIVFFARHNGMWMNVHGNDLVLLSDDKIALKFSKEQIEGLDALPKYFEEGKL